MRTTFDTTWHIPETRAIAEAELAAEVARQLAPFALGHIYVIEFSSGVVKVGKTTDPKRRLAAHASLARVHGGAIRASWMSQQICGYDDAERELIRLCAQVAGPVVGREYFDIGLREALSLATLVEANRLAAIDLPDDARALLDPSFTGPNQPPPLPLPAPGPPPVPRRGHLPIGIESPARRDPAEPDPASGIATSGGPAST